MDANNYFRFTLDGTTLVFQQVTNGQSVTHWTSGLPTNEPQPNHHLAVDASHSTVRLYWNGNLMYENVNVYAFQNARRFGLQTAGVDPTSQYDYLTIWGLLPPSPATVTITPASSNMLFQQQQTLVARGYDANGTEIQGLSFDWTSLDPSRVTASAEGIHTGRVTATGVGHVTVHATSVWGPTATATVTIGPGNTSLFDGFSGTAGTGLASHLPEVNQMEGPWTVSGNAAPSLLNGRLKNGNGDGVALIDAGTPNVLVHASWRAGSTSGGYAGVVFRATDTSNYFVWQIYGDNVALKRRQNGVFSTIWSTSLGAIPQGDQLLSVNANGALMTVAGFGVEYTFSDSTNINATKYGFQLNTLDPEATYNSFWVMGDVPPAPARVEVTPSSVAMLFGQLTNVYAQAFDANNQPMPNVTFQWSSSNSNIVQVFPPGTTSAGINATGLGVATIMARPPRGPVGTTSVAVSPGSTVAWDAFSAADGTLLSAHTPGVSQMTGAWTVDGDFEPVIQNGAVTAPSAAAGESIALVEGGTPNASTYAWWTPGTAMPYHGGFIFRATDSQNLFLYAMAGEQLQLWRRRHGAWMKVWEQSLAEAERGPGHHRFWVVLNGPNIALWWDNDLKAEVQDTFNQYATKYGVRLLSNGSSYDALLITGSLPPTVQNLAVTPATVELAPYESVTLNASLSDGVGAPVAGALSAWRSQVPRTARVNLTGPSTAVVTGQEVGLTSVIASVPRGTASPITVPVDVRICVSPLTNGFGTVGHAGGLLSVPVDANANCLWQSVTLSAWLSVSSGSSGTGQGTTSILAAANNTAATRTGHVAIGGRIFAVTQLPTPNTCVTGLSPGQALWPADGGVGDFGLVADSSCQWAATSSDPGWLQVLDESGQGSSSPRFRVLPNPTNSTRSATIGAGSGSFTVTQSAGPCSNCALPPPPSACSYRVDVWSVQPESGTFEIVTEDGCAWTASTDVPGLNLTRLQGVGHAIVGFTIQPLSQQLAQGKIYVAGTEIDVAPATNAITVPGICMPIPVRCGPESPLPFCTIILCSPLLQPRAPRQDVAPTTPRLWSFSNVVRRGDLFTVYVQGGTEWRNWRFTPDNGMPMIQRSSNPRDDRWAGVLVTSGTVTVEARHEGNWIALDGSIA